jgi:hypothetical protein
MYEYFTHSTFNLKDIIQSGGLDDAFTDKDAYDNIGIIPNGIYCHYIWDGLPIVYPDMKWAYNPIIFVMDTSIAKRNEMYICDSVSYGHCVEHPESRILHSKGNLKRKPNLNPLKKKILEDLQENVEQKKLKRTNKNMNVYLHSHEVIFKGKIPLTFVKAILIPKSNYKRLGNETQRLEEYLKERSIQLIPYAPHTKNFHKYYEMINP